MKKLLLLVIGLVLFAPSVAKAAPQIDMTCTPKALYPGGSGTCVIFANLASGTIGDFAATVTASEKVRITGYTKLGNWDGLTSNGNIALTLTPPMGPGRVDILSVAFQVEEDWAGGDCVINVQVGGANITREIPVNPDKTNPQTGLGPDTITYVIIGAGAVLALSTYYIATKKNKFYKI